MEKYKLYKDSGFGWIGKVPEHWKESRVKYKTNINKRTLSEKTNPQYTFKYIDIGSVDGLGNISTLEEMNFGESPSRARRIVQAGDTIISTVRTYLKAITGIDEVNENLICSTGFAVLTPKSDVNPKYLKFLFRSSTYIEEIVKRSKGVSYPAITSTEIGDLHIFLPPMKEQEKIAQFLYKKNLEFDTLISKKNNLINNLLKARQTLIFQVVTKGLDHSEKMRNSGVEVIGEVPEHWDLTKIRYLSKKLKSGGTPNSNNQEYWNGNINWYTPEDFRFKEGKFLVTSERKVTKKGLNNCSSMIFKNGSIILTKRAPIGKVAITKFDTAINQGCFGIQLKDTVSNIYVYYYLSILDNYLNSLGKGTTFLELGLPEFKDILIPQPSYSEQLKIVDYLDKKTKEIDETISKIKKQIDILTKTQQCLITDVVTGKVDVRNEVINE